MPKVTLKDIEDVAEELADDYPVVFPSERTKECPTCKGTMRLVEDAFICPRPTCGHKEALE